MRSKKLPFYHIELFAGCGGMSLGLEASGFEMYFANELSPMAAETYAYNIINEDLSAISGKKEVASNVLWIKSRYNNKDLSNRLREDPDFFAYGKNTDLSVNTDLKGKLLVGNIDHLLQFLSKNRKIVKDLRNENIDLISGGPPCQSFSLAGRREKNNKKNLLPLSFAKFAGLIRPKFILLENVKGITAPFSEDGKKYHAWLEIAKAFALEKYVPVCMLLNSKYFGVPQNRQRFILLGIRNDIYNLLLTQLASNIEANTILNNSYSFYKKVRANKKRLDIISTSDLKLFKFDKRPDYFSGVLLPKISNSDLKFISTKEAIDDISDTTNRININEISSIYPNSVNKLFSPKNCHSEKYIQNHNIRNHREEVKKRFYLYQLLDKLNGSRNDFLSLIKNQEDNAELLQKVHNSLVKEISINSDLQINDLTTFTDFAKFAAFIKSIKSKKHSQRAIKPNEPAPSQMTIPDDLCHYSPNELRTLTVREMARLQSFPDWFVFRSKITTGGKQRKSEVPQYTQVGNAVPPLLAYHLGKTISYLLDLLQDD